jgi:tRNA-2-methylthio-N6-dimethylallyladenosine synthase
MKNLIEDIELLSPASGEACETVRLTEETNTGKSRKLYIES